MADDDYKKYGKAVKGETKAQAGARRAKFYTGQRKSDETKAKGNDASAGVELMSVGRKLAGSKKTAALGKKDQQIGARARLGMNQDEAAGRMRDPSDMKKKLAGAIPALAIGEGAGAAVGKIAGAAARGARGMIPEAEGMARSGMKNVTGTARKALPAARKAMPAPPKALPGKGSRGVRVGEGSSSTRPAAREQKALPKPKGPAPKMQHAKARAGSARSQQSTSRNAGTNPRAVRSGKMRAAQKSGKPTEDKDLLSTLKESVRQAKAKKKAS